jgi:hypothetical protein
MLQVFNSYVSTAEILTCGNGRKGSYCERGLRKCPTLYVENARKSKKTQDKSFKRI